MLERIEEALDEVAFTVEREVTRPLHFTIILLGRDDGSDFPLGECIHELIGIVGLVTDQGLWVGVLDQVMRLTRREHQLDRVAESIDEGMNFSG